MDSTDQPNSICHIQPIQMYPLPPPDTNQSPPFNLLVGETVIHYGTSVDGSIFITNYRLFIQICKNQHHIPLGLIEVVEHRELFYLHIGCKDARTYRCTFENNESCLEWYDKIMKASEPPRQLEQLFAFYYCVWAKEKGGLDVANKIDNHTKYVFDKRMFQEEMDRLQFRGDSWRISKVNKHYKLCPTYPPYLLVPSCITDETLESVAKFRSSRRIPAVVWRHTKNGAVIARCSQPEVGWLGWRSGEDEDLIKAIAEACNFDRNLRIGSDKESNLSHSPGSLHSDESLQITNAIAPQEKKFLIMDARSYTTAVANRARGGGCECPEYYPNCEIQFMNLANIHSIRKSFHALRALCMSSADQPNWFSQLEGTRWLLHMSGLMKAAVTLVTAVERDARPVMVHCSDGWDRTPQIVALAEVLLDPYYRTISGFCTLIEREWLAFGHKFADRCGHSSGSEDQNERCPVFLQWLDCVHQIFLQYPCAFEFSQTYLVKLAQHVYSNLFGTFLCNTQHERTKFVYGKTFSVWEFISGPYFRNHLYAPIGNACGQRVLWPQCNVRDLQLWSEVYLGSMEANFSTEGGSGSCPGPPEASPNHMVKTRSYGDLNTAHTEVSNNLFRRSSDPSINSDTKLAVLTSEIPQSSDPVDEDLECVSGGIAGDFLSHADLEDLCNNDCMFKDHPQNLTDDQIDGLVDRSSSKPPFPHRNGVVAVPRRDNNVINGDKTDSVDCYCELDVCDSLKGVSIKTCENKTGADVSSPGFCSSPMLDNNNIHNGNGKVVDDADSDTECTEPSESRSENTVCDIAAVLNEKSVETSTETLVSEHFACSSSPKEINGFEKVQKPVNGNETTDGCTATQSTNFINGTHGNHYSWRRSGDPSGYTTSPWDNTVHNNTSQQRTPCMNQYNLDDDGLVPLRSVVQERLDQIMEDQKRREDLLQKTLDTYRQARIKQICHKCNHGDTDRQDDNVCRFKKFAGESCIER